MHYLLELLSNMAHACAIMLFLLHLANNFFERETVYWLVLVAPFVHLI